MKMNNTQNSVDSVALHVRGVHSTCAFCQLWLFAHFGGTWNIHAQNVCFASKPEQFALVEALWLTCGLLS